MKLVAALLCLAITPQLFAKDLGCTSNSPPNALCSVSVTEISSNDAPSFLDNTSPISWGEIINIGKEIWKIINDNKPVVATQYDFATALPKGVASADDLENWQMPTSKTYKVAYKNALGAEVVDYNFSIVNVYGGSHAGKGKYIAHVALIPGRLNVVWAYTFAASLKVAAVYNTGTSAAPLATISLIHNWSVSTPIQREEQSQYFVVRGDGLINTVAN